MTQLVNSEDGDRLPSPNVNVEKIGDECGDESEEQIEAEQEQPIFCWRYFPRLILSFMFVQISSLRIGSAFVFVSVVFITRESPHSCHIVRVKDNGFWITASVMVDAKNVGFF